MIFYDAISYPTDHSSLRNVKHQIFPFKCWVLLMIMPIRVIDTMVKVSDGMVLCIFLPTKCPTPFDMGSTDEIVQITMRQ